MKKTVVVGVFAFVSLVGLSQCVYAQNVCTVGPCPVYTNQPFTVSADDTQNAVANVDGYRLWDNNAIIRDVTTAAARVGNTVSFVFGAGLPTAGSHSFQVSAYNFTGEGKSVPLVANVINTPPVPLAPGNIRIIK